MSDLMIPASLLWLLGKISDKIFDSSIEYLFGESVWKELDKALQSWADMTAKTFPQLQWRSFLRVYESDTKLNHVLSRQNRDKVTFALIQQESITIDDWLQALLEQWEDVRKTQGAEAEPFFSTDKEKVIPFLQDLARRLYNATLRPNDQFKVTALKLLQQIDNNTRQLQTSDTISPIWNVRQLRNPNFTGREKLLVDLHNSLISGNRTAITQAISGLGGIGKTQLATEYVYRYKTDYTVVWWVQSDNATILSHEYAELGRKLNLPEKAVQDQRILIAAVRDWLNNNKNWLLVFDNIRSSEALRDFIPQSQSGHVIITSRNTVWEGMANIINVREFERFESINYIHLRTDISEQDGPNELAEELGDLPLALAQATGYINSTKISIKQYLNLFKVHKAELLARRVFDSDYPFTVATTWSLSFDQAKKMTPIAENLIKIIGFFASDNIPRDLLKDVLLHMKFISNLEYEDAVAALHTNSLVEASVDLLSVHHLVQFVTSEQMSMTEKKEYIQIIVQVIDNTFSSLPNPLPDVRSWPVCTQLISHAIKVISFAEETNTLSSDLGSLMNWCGMYWYGHAMYADAEAFYSRALKIDEEQLGVDHLDDAMIMNNLAAVLQVQGKYAQAEPIFRRALAIREKQLDPDHPEVVISLNNLALLFQAMGKYNEAEQLYRRTIQICENRSNVNHPFMAASLERLAGLMRILGKHQDAEHLYHQVLTIKAKYFGVDHPDYADSLNDLGMVLMDQGKYSDAESLCERAVVILEKGRGADHPSVSISLNNFGRALMAQGKYLDAEPIFQRSLKINEKQLGPHHPNNANILDNLSILLQQKSQYPDALVLSDRALTIREKHQGVDHPDVANSLHEIATIFKNQGDYNKAEPLFCRALKIRENKLGKEHPYVADTLSELAGLYKSQSKYTDAELLFHRALKIREERLGSNHLNVAATLNDLAGMYKDQGEYTKSEMLYRRSLKILENQLETDHPYIITSLISLAFSINHQGRYNDAEPFFCRALEALEESLGPEHPITKDVRETIRLLQENWRSLRTTGDNKLEG